VALHPVSRLAFPRPTSTFKMPSFSIRKLAKSLASVFTKSRKASKASVAAQPASNVPSDEVVYEPYVRTPIMFTVVPELSSRLGHQ
jgi:hypothetical protein